MTTRFARIALPGVALLAAACSTTQDELERVAKDWCLTIRASQVLPVYPLNEDVQPGDVFLVPTPLSQQTEVYQARGFLPLDQLVQRLGPLPYDTFYRAGYWNGTYAAAPHQRPGWDETRSPVLAPRVAFPAYNFSVQRGGGLKLALPISGVPVGLGVMGSSRATGSVTIRDAYGYGLDGETLVRRLHEWWLGSPELARVFTDMTQSGTVEVYLRVVTRVFLTRGVTVQLTNLEASAAGADVGVAPALSLIDLARQDPTKIEASAQAYRAALEAISTPLGPQGAAAGGAFRFTQASQRSVTLDQDFDRPLVLGYLGFDVKVFPDGRLSAPIPSYATIAEGSTAVQHAPALTFATEDPNSGKLRELMRDEARRTAILQWALAETGAAVEPADLIWAEEHRGLRARAVQRFAQDTNGS